MIPGTVSSKILRIMQQPVFSYTEKPIWNFEQEPYDEQPDETSYNLRAYLDRMPDEKMLQYRHEWTDNEVIEWCGDFKDDGGLLVACSERDVDVHEFRRVLEQAIAYRNRARSQLIGAGK